jgi:hypothetical protein
VSSRAPSSRRWMDAQFCRVMSEALRQDRERAGSTRR